jgi:hypothetical protein
MGWTEWIGYAASLLVAVSLMMSSLVRLRWLNLVGAVTFTVYGLVIRAYPVAVVNAFIVVINVWHLVQLGRRREHFDLLEVAGPDDPLVRKLLASRADEVTRLFPGRPAAAHTTVILRDLNPAGVVMWSGEGDTVRIHLDWVRPPYRDLKCARYLLERMAPVWRGAGHRRVVSPAAGQTHRDYLHRLGFRPSPDAGDYERELDGA